MPTDDRAVKYLAASIDGVLPAVIDYEHADLVRVEVGREWLSFWSRLVEELVIARRKIAGYVAEFLYLSPKQKVCGDAQDQGYAADDSHKQIIANALIFAPTLFYLTGGTDAYTLPKIWLAVGLMLFWAIRYRVGHSLLQLPLLCYLLALSFSSLFADYPALAIMGQGNWHGTGLFPTMLVVCAFQMGHGTSKDGLLRALVLTGAILSLSCLAQKLGVLTPYNLSDGRAYGFLGSAVYSGGMLGICSVAAVSMGHLGAAALMLAGILATGSRVGILALISGLTVLQIAKCNIRTLSRLLPAVLACGIFLQATRNSSLSDKFRGWMLITAAEAFATSPLIGVGPEQFTAQFEKYRKPEWDKALSRRVTNAHCHNSVAEAFMSTGVIGGVMFLGLMLGLAWNLRGQPTHLAIFAALAVYSMFQPVPLTMKLPLALVLGSAIPAVGYIPNALKWGYVAILGVVLMAVVSMWSASRSLLVAASVGDVPAIQRAYARSAPLYEMYHKGIR